jgi:hypothetical protein
MIPHSQYLKTLQNFKDFEIDEPPPPFILFEFALISSTLTEERMAFFRVMSPSSFNNARVTIHTSRITSSHLIEELILRLFSQCQELEHVNLLFSHFVPSNPGNSAHKECLVVVVVVVYLR